MCQYVLKWVQDVDNTKHHHRGDDEVPQAKMREDGPEEGKQGYGTYKTICEHPHKSIDARGRPSPPNMISVD